MVLLPDGRKKVRAEGVAEGVVIGRAQGVGIGRVEGRAEGVEEGVAKGRAQVLPKVAAWRQWNARRLEFEARGEPFDEPPPDDDFSDEELNGKA